MGNWASIGFVVLGIVVYGLLFHLNRHQRVPWGSICIASVGVLRALTQFVIRPSMGNGALAAVLVLVAVFFVYVTVFYTRTPPHSPTLGPGSPFPDVPLHNLVGEKSEISDLQGESGALVVFFRGSGCPACRRELQLLQSCLPDIQRRGLALVAISVEAPEVSARLREQLGLGFHVLCDTEFQLTDALALRHERGYLGKDVATPTHFLVDARGIIRWVHRAYHTLIRPSLNEILSAIDDALPPGGVSLAADPG